MVDLTSLSDAPPKGQHDDPQPVPGMREPHPASVGAIIAGNLLFENISHSFADKHVLDGVSLAVNPGETVCLLGASGCGKTTLLRIAAGIERPTSGSVYINSQEMSGPRVFVPPEKRDIGFVFQDFALFPHLNILQNVMFGLKALSKHEAETVAKRAISRVRMDDYLTAYPHTLSGGQQQRVALARAVAPRPQVMLLDEPFSGLDSALREEIREETFAILKETRATSIFVTHDPDEALLLGDRVALMRDGKIEQIGTPKELYRNPKNGFVAGFFGGLNMFEGVVKEGCVVETPLGHFPAPGFPPNTPVNVFIRMEGVDIREVDDNDGLAHGRVLNERFSGHDTWVSVLIDGDHAPLQLKINSRRLLKTELVSFVVDPSAVLIFTKSEK